jgi:HD superfamily phosphohydrolase
MGVDIHITHDQEEFHDLSQMPNSRTLEHWVQRSNDVMHDLFTEHDDSMKEITKEYLIEKISILSSKLHDDDEDERDICEGIIFCCHLLTNETLPCFVFYST